MRVGCLLIPRFGLACELTEQPALREGPKTIALVAGRIVEDVSPAAERYGVCSGQRTQEAFAACPYLVTLESRPGHYQRRFQILLDRLAAIAPEIEPGPPGVAYVNLTGLERHYSESERLAARLLSCASALMGPRLGIAPGKFPAFVVANRLRAGKSAELPPQRVADMLAEVSVGVLPVDHRMLRRLHQLGLHTLGDLSALPRQAVAAQFGPDGACAWDLASGADRARIQPLSAQETVAAAQLFIDAIASREFLLAAGERVFERAQHALQERHQAARLARIRLELERGKVWEQQVTFKESRNDRSQLWTALRPALERADPPEPVVGITVTFSDLSSVIGWQQQLWQGKQRQRRQRLQEALRQLAARYGTCPVGRVVEVEPWSRIPERRAAIVACEP